MRRWRRLSSGPWPRMRSTARVTCSVGQHGGHESGSTRMRKARDKSTSSAAEQSMQASLRMGEMSQKKWFRTLEPQNVALEIKG